MKRLFYVSGNFSVKMFEAPVAWQRFPNACLRVTTAAVRSTDFHDLDRLFSALIRIVRRKMTFNEASASHHISLKVIREVYKQIFSTMSDVMMRLMNDKKKDIELKGDEMDERSFQFDQVTEQDLITSTNENGEEYAVVDPLMIRSKLLCPKEEEDHIHRAPDILSFPPQQLTSIKEEDDKCSTSALSFRGIEPLFTNDEDHLMYGVVKEEAMSPPLSQKNADSSLNFNIDDFGYYESMEEEESRVKMEEEEPKGIESLEDRDEENAEISEAIEMALKSSKLVGNEADMMREALKDSMLRGVSVRDLVELYGFADQPSICYLINKSRVFLKGICRIAGKDLPVDFSSSSIPTKEFHPGEPIDPLDIGRIQTIREAIHTIVRRSWYQQESKEKLKAALFAVCFGELNVNAASIKFDLHSATVASYVHRARQRLGSILPPQTRAPSLWINQMKKFKPHEETASTQYNSSTSEKKCYTTEEVDRIVSEFVIISQYDSSGKQAIFDAVIAVITERISAPDASERMGIQTSIVQPYVTRAKRALKITGRTDVVEFTPRRKEPPIIALMKMEGVASREEVESCTSQLLVKVCGDSNRCEAVFRAIVAVVMGEKTIRNASEDEGLSRSTVHPYTMKVRHMLGQRCPPPKSMIGPALTKIEERIDDNSNTIQECETVTIDGIIVPKSIELITRLLTIGKLDYSKSRPFQGTRDELREEMISIIHAFNYQGNALDLVDGIINVYVNDQTITQTCDIYHFTIETFSLYVRAIKIFIDFAKSPSTSECQNEVIRIPHGVSKDSEDSQMLFIPSERGTIDWDIMSEEINEEVIEHPMVSPGFLSAEDQLEDAEWNGEGYDYITRKMMTLYECDNWKFDENGEINAELLPTLLLSKVPDSMKMERMKCVIQYVVNDRHGGLRERLYIRPLLIHHLCNGFSIDYLLSLYEHRIPITQEQLTEYCTIITDVYKKSGKIIAELMANITKCGKIFSDENEEKANLKKEMSEKCPFLLDQQSIPSTEEKLSDNQLKGRKDFCDCYLYYAFIAITQLRNIGYLLPDSFIDEIIRILSFNIPSGLIFYSTEARLWAQRYLKTAMKRNIVHV